MSSEFRSCLEAVTNQFAEPTSPHEYASRPIVISVKIREGAKLFLQENKLKCVLKCALHVQGETELCYCAQQVQVVIKWDRSGISELLRVS